MRIARLGAALVALAGCSGGTEARILEIARGYPSFGRVEEAVRWAPAGCRAPIQLVASPRPSASRDASTHGRKLYYLFARDRGAYLHARELDQPVGQVLVKESWVPQSDAPEVPTRRGPLFVMWKTGGSGTDDGWIYATLSPEGTEVTASGKLASCMECHESAKRDRLFGVTTCAAPE